MQQLTTHDKRTSGKTEISRFNTVPLYVQLRDAVLLRITAGVWLPEKPIPNEGELAREFGVSAGTMRKALDMLEADHVLIRRQGRGTFVLDKQAEDMDRLASCLCRVKEVALQARYEPALAEAQPTEPLSLFRHRMAQAMFKAKADYRKDYDDVYLAPAKRTLLLVAHEELIADHLKNSPADTPKEAHAKTIDRVRDHLLGESKAA